MSSLSRYAPVAKLTAELRFCNLEDERPDPVADAAQIANRRSKLAET